MTQASWPKLQTDFYWRKGSLYVVKNLIVAYRLEEMEKNWILHPDAVVMCLGFDIKMHYNSRTEPLIAHIELFFLDEDKIVVATFPTWEQAGYSLAYRNPKTGQMVDWKFSTDFNYSFMDNFE